MKKVLNLVLLGLYLFYFIAVNSTVPLKTNQVESEFNAPDWTREEYLSYYAENNIAPATVPDPSIPIGVIDGVNTTVRIHLLDRFPSFSNWKKSENGSNSVSSTYGANPVDSNENDNIIQTAKLNSSIRNYDFIGCGPLALLTEMKYLANYGGYTQFINNPESRLQNILLAENIFNTIWTYPSNGFWGTIIDHYYDEELEGTFTFPSDLVNGGNRLLEKYQINANIGTENIQSDGSYEKHLNIAGDLIPIEELLSEKMTKVKESIDLGIPVILWTTGDAGGYSNHMMNIYSYETWIGKDSSNNIKEHLMLKVNMNWIGRETYLDSDLLDATNCGFIYFKPITDRIFITPEDYHFPQQYNSSQITSTLNVNNNLITTKRLRTGYINETGITGQGDWHLTMSARKSGAGSAYLEYNLPRIINYVYFDIRLWGTSEVLNSSNSRSVFQYKNSSGEWIDAINFYNSRQSMSGFSYLKDYPDIYRVDFPYGVKDFRFYSIANNPTNSTNSGRIVIGTIGVVFDNNVNNNELFVSIYSNDSNGSSNSSLLGHSWIEIYNNSTQSFYIGHYLLLPFSGVTVGTYGNKSHLGIYYNLEYLNYISQTNTPNNGSIYTNGSTYSSEYYSNDYNSNDGRVSLTNVVSLFYYLYINVVLNSSDSWGLFDNCTNFATNVWNTVSDIQLSVPIISTPSNLKNQIKNISNVTYNRPLCGNSVKVGYYQGNSFVYTSS